MSAEPYKQRALCTSRLGITKSTTTSETLAMKYDNVHNTEQAKRLCSEKINEVITEFKKELDLLRHKNNVLTYMIHMAFAIGMASGLLVHEIGLFLYR